MDPKSPAWANQPGAALKLAKRQRGRYRTCEYPTTAADALNAQLSEAFISF